MTPKKKNLAYIGIFVLPHYFFFFVIFYNHGGYSCLLRFPNNVRPTLHVRPKALGSGLVSRPKLSWVWRDCQTQNACVRGGFIEKKENIILLKK